MIILQNDKKLYYLMNKGWRTKTKLQLIKSYDRFMNN